MPASNPLQAFRKSGYSLVSSAVDRTRLSQGELLRLVIFFALLGLSVPANAQDIASMDPADLAVKALTEDAEFLDPGEILAWVELPRSVKKGDRLTLRVSVENARETSNFDLASVDLDGSFLKGFRIESITPSPNETDDSFNTLSLEYPMRIAAGETVDFVLEMIAVEVGVYIGEVSIWNEENFLSRYVQCKVAE